MKNAVVNQIQPRKGVIRLLIYRLNTFSILISNLVRNWSICYGLHYIFLLEIIDLNVVYEIRNIFLDKYCPFYTDGKIGDMTEFTCEGMGRFLGRLQISFEDRRGGTYF